MCLFFTYCLWLLLCMTAKLSCDRNHIFFLTFTEEVCQPVHGGSFFHHLGDEASEGVEIRKIQSKENGKPRGSFQYQESDLEEDRGGKSEE